MTQKTIFKKLINFRAIFYSFLAFLFGILCSRSIFAGNILYIVFTSVAFALIALACALYKKWIPIVLIAVSFFAGTAFYYVGISTFFGKTYQGEQEVVARVTDVITENDYYYSVVLDDCHISGESGKNIYLSIRKDYEIELKNGDVLSFKSKIEKVHLFELGKFNSYYLRNRVAYESSVKASEITAIEGKIKFDEKIRVGIKQILYQNMSKDSADVAFAMLTGDKSDLDKEIKDDYSGAGIIHILAVSGLHVTFLIGALSFLLKKCRLNKFVNFALIAVLVVFYAYICNFTPSVVRASVMGLVLISAGLFGEEYDRLTSLGVAGFLILLVSPLSAFDIGFLMSFACVGSIFLLARPIEKLFSSFLPKYFAGATAVSISAELGILPFLAFMGQGFNLLSFIINLLIIPLFEVIFILLIVSVILGLIPYVGAVLWLSDWGIHGINFLAKFFASTGAKVTLKEVNILVVSLYFIGLFAISAFFMASKKVKAFLASFIFCFISVYTLIYNLMPYNYNSTCYVLSNNGYQSVILVSENGESAFVGDTISAKDERLLSVSGLKQVDYSFAINLKEKEVPDFILKSRDVGAKSIVTCSELKFSNDNELANKNEKSFEGSFKFEYIYFESTYLGLKIDFDNHSIFFASNGVLSYNSNVEVRDFVSSTAFDVVYLNKKAEMANCFGNTKQIVSCNDGEKVDYSYEINGNIQIDLNNNVIRSID